MSTDLTKRTFRPRRRLSRHEPTWEIARLFPAQGDWSEEEYFSLDDNHFVEYSDGFLEFLPMPTIFHQLMVQFLFKLLDAFVAGNTLGTVVVSGYKVRLRSGKYREADIVFIKTANRSRIKEQYCEKADLVIEVLSDRNRRHDIRTKRAEYATAGISEYWIVDPHKKTVTVLVLKPRKKEYAEYGVFKDGTRASSKLLAGFTVDVTTLLSQKP
jgi:Uma2 family endonuclease